MVAEDNSEVAKLQERIKRMRYGHFQEKVELVKALEKEFGSEVNDVVIEHVIDVHKKHWAKVAEKEGENGIPALLRTLWEPMKGNFEFTYEEKDEGIQMDVTFCPLAKMAQELDEADWGFRFYCMSDYGIVEGFNPKIGFKRTKTLMEGDRCCDHFYFMKEEDGKE
ncbi:MAG: hypothetical protein GF308_09545 [Candidatus Heimdallarchaeota archaeon]|nr:hypothetical protein [Candidatus Heimdallarchaeota archaeon]